MCYNSLQSLLIPYGPIVEIKDQENIWGFGQVVAPGLLILPIFGLFSTCSLSCPQKML